MPKRMTVSERAAVWAR
jgi:DNA repair exonuclease SbcCD ATPase subunit